MIAAARGRKKVRVRPILLAALAALSFPATAFAAEAEGEWLVANHKARIRIVDCAQRLWGIVSWEFDPAIDTENPDPAKRARPRFRDADSARDET